MKTFLLCFEINASDGSQRIVGHCFHQAEQLTRAALEKAAAGIRADQTDARIKKQAVVWRSATRLDG